MAIACEPSGKLCKDDATKNRGLHASSLYALDHAELPRRLMIMDISQLIPLFYISIYRRRASRVLCLK